jgi:hypothetical protein
LLDQRREERNDREMAAVQLRWREAARVDREQSLERVEFLPGGAEHPLERLPRLTALRLGIARCLSDLSDRVLHDGIEERLTGGEVDVDRGADDARPAVSVSRGGGFC